ncbi:AraC family transcriptional regulator [Labrys okinawensis]|uniref:AraC family transcriptional regulator n=1 Tax=Labrys okinawensis TaxID=346911 RepID=UPI0039BD8B9B
MSSNRQRERYFKDVVRPVIPLRNDYPDGFFIEPHYHRRHQLLYASCGVVVVGTPHGTWVMPPQRGMWIPSGVIHDVKILGAVTMQSLYFEPDDIVGMPPQCQVLGISPFMQSLLAEAVQLPVEYEMNQRAAALMALIQHEVRLMPHLSLSLPFPSHWALAERCRSFLRRPNAHQTIDNWSNSLGMGRRSFTRLFKKETGLSFVEWRQQACLVSALPRLVAGEAVTTIAIDLGYDNPAAFTTMFKRVLGASPRTYLGSVA